MRNGNNGNASDGLETGILVCGYMLTRATENGERQEYRCLVQVSVRNVSVFGKYLLLPFRRFPPQCSHYPVLVPSPSWAKCASARMRTQHLLLSENQTIWDPGTSYQFWTLNSWGGVGGTHKALETKFYDARTRKVPDPSHLEKVTRVQMRIELSGLTLCYETTVKTEN